MLWAINGLLENGIMVMLCSRCCLSTCNTDWNMHDATTAFMVLLRSYPLRLLCPIMYTWLNVSVNVRNSLIYAHKYPQMPYFLMRTNCYVSNNVLCCLLIWRLDSLLLRNKC